jgi:serine protease AprX
VKYKLSSIPIALSTALVAGVLLTGVAGAAPGTGRKPLDRNVRVHPQLQFGAQVEPNKKVRVLVQKASASQNSRDIAHRGRANVREDFGMVSASSMEILQKDVLELAKDPRVLFISPDGALTNKGDRIDKQRTASATRDNDRDRDDDDDDHDYRDYARLRISQVRAAGTVPDEDDLLTTYPIVTNAPEAWENSKGALTGAGVTVAVLDTGVNPFHPDLKDKVFPVFVNPLATGYLDEHGHGTHVAGIINGRSAGDEYVGIAPDARVISVKIADDRGAARESDMLRGLQWVYDNNAKYNIKVVNLSLAAATPQSYKSSPIDASVEKLWQAGITVVASAGNRGSEKGATWYAPGNDPFVITVGCLDDNQTEKSSDDKLCTFGSRGKTQDGVYKPDLIAPGRKIVAPLSDPNAQLATEYPDRVTADKSHMRLSGTSMATPVVSGAIALILQRYPNLKPNQIKWLLTDTTRSYSGQRDKAGLLDIEKAIEKAGSSLREANLGLVLSTALTPGANAATGQTSAYWDSAYWDSAYWDSAYWDSAYWDSAYWDSAGKFD